MSIPNILESNHLNKFEIEKAFASLYQLLEKERKKLNLNPTFAKVEINPLFLDSVEEKKIKCVGCGMEFLEDCFYKAYGKARARCKECIKKNNLKGYHEKKKKKLNV